MYSSRSEYIEQDLHFEGPVFVCRDYLLVLLNFTFSCEMTSPEIARTIPSSVYSVIVSSISKTALTVVTTGTA